MVSLPILPKPEDPRLSRPVSGIDQDGRETGLHVAVERPLTIFLNGQEIVTAMTVGDYPDYLAVGYLLNQLMLKPDDRITRIEVEPEIDTVVVRTERRTNFEEKLKKKVQTSGCAQGTVFGDLMEDFEQISLNREVRLPASQLRQMLKSVTSAPSLYQKAGALHGCALCRGGELLIYMEDVGRHNAVDKIAGALALEKIDAKGALLYTTGRLTSEMVIKTVRMGVPILVSCSGFTAWGVDLARQAGLTLIGRAKGRNFLVLAGEERVQFDQ
jgi:FdhD protein